MNRVSILLYVLPKGRMWNEHATYAQKWEDRISGEFVSKYAVFSHKGGVRILVDNPLRAHARVILLCVLSISNVRSLCSRGGEILEFRSLRSRD